MVNERIAAKVNVTMGGNMYLSGKEIGFLTKPDIYRAQKLPR